MSFAARVERENERIIVTRTALVHERKGKNDRKRKANYSRTGVISIRFSFGSEYTVSSRIALVITLKEKKKEKEKKEQYPVFRT